MGIFERFAAVPVIYTGPWVDGIPGVTKVIGDDIVPQSGTTSVGFGAGAFVIYLDGDYGNPILFSDLPTGFTVVSASVHSGVAITSLADAILTCPTYISSTPFDGATQVFVTAPIVPPPSNIELFALATIEVAVETQPSPQNSQVAVSLSPADPNFYGQIGIFGEYSTFSFSYTMDPPDGSDVNPGDVITITSEDDGLDLSQLTLSGFTILLQNANFLSFIVPIGVIGSIPIVVVGNGTQFSGSVTLGTLNILNTPASGIYTLVKNKTSDTLYDNDNPGETFDVMIPSPFGRSGFIGG